MDSPFKEYAIATIAIILAVCIVELLIMDSWLDLIMTAILMTCGYVCLVLGLYMFLEAKGEKNINGMDWSSMTEEEIRNVLSYWGLFMIIGSILLMLALAVIMSYITYGIALIVASVAFPVAPLAVRNRAKKKPFVPRARGTKITVFALATVIAVVPSVYILNYVENEEAISIEFTDSQLVIRAPMANGTYDYSGIEELTLDPDFDKGKRIMGYGTTVICSGTYDNSAFGQYTLASYTKVDSCIFFHYEGEYYAFNQFDAELTLQAYETLLEKIAA